VVPGERRAPLKPWSGYRQDSDVRSACGRPGDDGEAESFGGELDERAEVAGLGGDPRVEPGIATGVLEQGAQAAAAREGDHRMLAQLAYGDRLAPAEGMAALGGEHQWLDRDHTRADSWWERMDAQPDDAGVDLAAGNGGKQGFVVLARERDLDRGMGPMEIAEGLGEAVIYRPRDADAESAVEQSTKRGDRLATSLSRSESSPRVRQQRLARSREGDGAPIAMEERLPQLALELSNLCTNRRLGNRHAGGGAGELSLLGDRDEVRQLP
jgi:hypothetical protein